LVGTPRGLYRIDSGKLVVRLRFQGETAFIASDGTLFTHLRAVTRSGCRITVSQIAARHQWEVLTVTLRSAVASVSYNRDGWMVAAATRGALLQLLNDGTGALLGYCATGGAEITAFALSGDSRRAATGTALDEVHMYDLQPLLQAAHDYHEELRYRSHGSVVGMPYTAWERLGRWFEKAMEQQKPRVISSEQRETWRVSCRAGRICGMAFSADDRMIAICGADGSVRILAVDSGKTIVQLGGHVGGANVAAFSPDGRRLATGGEDCSVRCWEVASGRQECCWRARPVGRFGFTFEPV
jgi:WD40 repeat protein